MLERVVVIHYDFVHVLRPGNARIVEGHLGLGPRRRRGSLVLGQRPHRPGAENGARARTPAVLAAGRPLLLLAMRHELEPVPGLLGVAGLAARRRVLSPPHALGLVHGGTAAARELGVVEVTVGERAAASTAASRCFEGGRARVLAFGRRRPAARAAPRGVELRWGPDRGRGGGWDGTAGGFNCGALLQLSLILAATAEAVEVEVEVEV